jgi:hypothetical protein
LFVALFSKIMASINVITKSIPFSSLEKQQSLRKEPKQKIRPNTFINDKIAKSMYKRRIFEWILLIQKYYIMKHWSIS